jgi:hypothetical protein
MYQKCMEGLSSESALDRMDGRPYIHRMYSNRIFFFPCSFAILFLTQFHF